MRSALAFAVVLLVACSSDSPDTVDPADWKPLAPLAGGARQELAVVELGGRVYVIGGLDPQGVGVSRVEVYDPLTDAWASRAPLPEPLHHVNAAAVGGRLYVVGGLGDDFAAVGSTYAYEPGTDTWTAKQGMPAGTERGASGVAVIGSRIYVAGGLRGRSVDEVSAYDTTLDTWESLRRSPSRSITSWAPPWMAASTRWAAAGTRPRIVSMRSTHPPGSGPLGRPCRPRGLAVRPGCSAGASTSWAERVT